MKDFTDRSEILTPYTCVDTPVNEQFAQPARLSNIWQDDDLCFTISEQGYERKNVANVISCLIDKLPLDPTYTLEQALQDEVISADELGSLFDALTILIADDDYERIILYMPFEFLPYDSFFTDNQGLNESLKKFRSTYMTAWRHLLTTEDVRANFIDGDVLEPDYREIEPKRVIKSAHFVTQLITRGMIDLSEVHGTINNTNDDLLRRSLAEGLHALDVDEARNDKINRKQGAISTNRMSWVIDLATQKELQDKAQHLSEQIANGISFNEIMALLPDKKPDSNMQIIAEGLYLSIEQSFFEYKSATTRERLALFTEFFKSIAIYDDKLPKANEQFKIAMIKLHKLGLLDKKTIDGFGIDDPNMVSPYSSNFDRFADRLKNVKNFAMAIENNQEISQFVYPVVLVGGSRIKGYGLDNSDLDIGIFIKPHTPTEMKSTIRQMLRTEASHNNIDETCIEFWLQDTDSSKLGVKIHEDYDPIMADKYWSHLLFNTSWVGPVETVNILKEKILTPYFKAQPKIERKMYIERLEQDLLQYRLMHKGFHRFSPNYLKAIPQIANSVDGDSAFWDPGYRRLAIKIFVSSVFLPTI